MLPNATEPPPKPTPAPDGYRNLAPYLIIRGADEAIAYYALVFGAKEEFRISDPEGHVLFAKLHIGDSQLMLADEFIEWGVRGPQTIGGTPAMVHLFSHCLSFAYPMRSCANVAIQS